jgi:beta-fructofuranosidase
MKQDLILPSGYRLEFWAAGTGFLRISIDGIATWQVPSFASYPAFFRYHHREACEVAVEWDNPDAILWAYGYDPATVSETGITVWEFDACGLILSTGAEIDAWMRADPDRPVMHFSPIRQWMNDPNGLCKIGDTWHIFYQFHPASTDWGPMHWGHATSKDLFNWTHLPVFLHPEQNYWRLGATGGAFSGNAFRDRSGADIFFYTERLPAYDLFEGYRELQKIARPGRDVLGAGAMTQVLEERPPGVEHDFRDPKVWWDASAAAYRMVLGASLEGDPAVLLFGSDDLFDWTYLGALYRAPARFREEGARAVECPDFFPLDGKWVLVMGFVGHTDPESGRHNLLYALVGDFEGDVFKPDREELQLLDFGTDFYAMQSFHADGRQIAFAWLFNWESRKPAGSPYSGEMSLPRELMLDRDDRLCMQVVEEYETAWPCIALEPSTDGTYTLQDAPFDVKLNGELDGTRITASQDGARSFEVSVDGGTLVVALPQDDGTIRYAADISDTNDLRILHDRGIVEIFADGGAICGTRRNYTNVSPNQLVVTSEAAATVLRRTERERIW